MKILTVLSLFMLLVSSPAFAGIAKFSCDYSSDITCYYTIFRTGSSGFNNFTLDGGESDSVGGIEAGDTYCMSTEGVPDEDSCEQQEIKNIH